MGKKKESYIQFNFDISAYRLLGRELITDRITALFEIVKNAYDANADRVKVIFSDVSPLSNISRIIIEDDGIGMDIYDIQHKWMVIGTSSKRRERVSPSPYYRKVVGKKGIGRFAVDLLGSKLLLKTKKKGDRHWIYLETDWTKYNELENIQLQLPFGDHKEYFTDIKNRYWFEEGDINAQGTVIEIEAINDEWTEYDVIRAYKELAKLVAPNTKIKTSYPFSITIYSQYPDFKKIDVNPLSIIEFATKSIDLTFNIEDNTQEIILLENGKLIKKNVPARSFGLVNFTLYYFNLPDKRKFKDKFNVDIDGVKIYRDGLITTPFAESEADSNKKKDIIGIDKRRYSGFFDKINNRDLLGYVLLTDENNPNIIETTNRQDFIDNYSWRELKAFIIEQIVQVEKSLQYEKENIRQNTKYDLVNANDDLKHIRQTLTQAKREATPEVKNLIQLVESDLGRLQGTVNRSIKDYTKLEDESKQKENLFFSLVSLQTYASMFSHMTKHTIGHILRDAEYFKDNFPDEKLNERFKIISSRIFNELITLRNGVDFMLKYAKSDNEVEDINLHNLVHDLFGVYSNLFQKEKIATSLELKDNLILTYNKKALEDVFDNLISNSVKALKSSANKKIKCSGVAQKNELILYFSDNGNGILEEDKLRIFDIFFTRTAEDGGAGIGLYMVKTRIEAMQGTIEVVESEFTPGATFKITLPFKK